MMVTRSEGGGSTGAGVLLGDAGDDVLIGGAGLDVIDEGLGDDIEFQSLRCIEQMEAFTAGPASSDSVLFSGRIRGSAVASADWVKRGREPDALRTKPGSGLQR